jgi:hypothetical protein
MRFFRHEKRPAWGTGRVIAEQGDRLKILFEDGKERSLLVGAPGLAEVATEAVPKDSPARATAPAEVKAKLAKVKPSRLIKSVRLAIRDGLDALKAVGAFPDDTLVEMQKGLSRITADHARFAGSTAAIVRKADAKSARALHAEHTVPALFAELGSRLYGGADRYENRTRAYLQPEHATDALQKIGALIDKGATLSDDEIEVLVELLTPPDLKDERG